MTRCKQPNPAGSNRRAGPPHTTRKETQMTPLQSDALAMLALFICIAVLALI
jgi:hypothetical protein